MYEELIKDDIEYMLCDRGYLFTEINYQDCFQYEYSALNNRLLDMVCLAKPTKDNFNEIADEITYEIIQSVNENGLF